MEGKNESLISMQAEITAMRTAVTHWTDATTSVSSPRRKDIRRDKEGAVISFFAFCGKSLGEIIPEDVKAWQIEMETRNLAETTIYTRISHLSSFFRWAMKDFLPGRLLMFNPVIYALPKAPKPYGTRKPKALTKKQIESLLGVIRARARSGDLIGKRDYALIILYLMTGMRRSEIMGLRGTDIRFEDERIIIRARIKGGNYSDREVDNPNVFNALYDYLRSSQRLTVLRKNEPLWIRHDRVSCSPGPLSSWSFVENLKKYAKIACIGDIHLHQMRHTFASVVAQSTGSISEAQEALGHGNISTTRHYVASVPIKKDRFSQHMMDAFDLLSD